MSRGTLTGDNTSYLEPRQFSDGIEYLLLNGRFTMDHGKQTGARPGVVIARTGTAARPRRAVTLSPGATR